MLKTANKCYILIYFMESFLSDNRAFYCAISADERLTGQETKMDQFVRFTKQDGTVRLFYIILRTFFLLTYLAIARPSRWHL